MSKPIIYPGTFDPITNVISISFPGQLVSSITSWLPSLAVLESQRCFSTEERLDLATRVLEEYSNVSVMRFDGLLVKFVAEQNSAMVLRGLRAVSDFEYEFQLAGMNRKMDANIDTVFLTPSEQFTYISSSLIREISKLGGDVSTFVHPVVNEALAQRRSGKP